MSILVGVLLSLVTAFAFGSYTSFNKVASVVESNINPIIFNLYFMFGALLVCAGITVAAIAIGYTIAFSYLGLISGLLLTLSGFCSFVAVPRIGVAYTWCIAATTGCITAFIEGMIMGTEIVHWWATIVALITLMSCAAVIVLIKDISSWIFPTAASELKAREKATGVITPGVTTTNVSMITIDESQPLTSHSSSQTMTTSTAAQVVNVANSANANSKSLMIGVLFSVIAGVFLASIPLPSLFVPANASGLCFFFSLGVGCLLVIPFTLISLIIDGMFQSRVQSQSKFEGLGYAFNESNFIDSESNMFVRCFKQCGLGVKYLLCETNESLWKARACLIPGVVSGIVWNGGNVAGILALEHINYIFLNALVAISTSVSAMYGVFLWRELTKTHEIVILFMATFGLISSNVLLAYGLYGNFV